MRTSLGGVDLVTKRTKVKRKRTQQLLTHVGVMVAKASVSL